MNGEVWLAALGGLILGWLGRALVAARARDVARLQAAATDSLAQARQTRAEVESFRSELKERDFRFRTLLNDRRHFAEQNQD